MMNTRSNSKNKKWNRKFMDEQLKKKDNTTRALVRTNKNSPTLNFMKKYNWLPKRNNKA